MPKYVVEAHVTISVYTAVEANSEEEAKEIADGRPMMSLCHHCAGDRDDDEQWRTNGELDGLPTALAAHRVKEK